VATLGAVDHIPSGRLKVARVSRLYRLRTAFMLKLRPRRRI
jgi:hypothetical protein